MLTNKGKYGLKAMLYLAEYGVAGNITGAEIAKAEGLPKKFLDAILNELTGAGLLHSRKGKGGGYALTRPADKIMVGDIVRALDGPLAPVQCVSRLFYRPCSDCRDEQTCRIRSVMGEVRDAIANVLDNMTLAEMRLRGDIEPALMYQI